MNIFKDLMTNVENCTLAEKLLQGTTDKIFCFTLYDRGEKLEIPASSEIEIIILYDPKVDEYNNLIYQGSYLLDKTSDVYDITIEQETIDSENYSIIKIPFKEEFVTFAGRCELILKVKDANTNKVIYTYGMFYTVDRNNGYFKKSTPNNLPTYEAIKKIVDDLKSQSDQNKQDIEDNVNSLATKAEKDLSNVLEFPSIPSGSVLIKKDGKIDHADIIVNGNDINAPTKTLTVNEVITSPNTVKIGPNISISENGGFLEGHTKSLNSYYLLLDYKNDPITGTRKPIYYARGPINEDSSDGSPIVIQPIKTSVMSNVSSFTIGKPPEDRQSQAIYFDAVSAITNLRIAIEVNGNIIAHHPSKNAWDGLEHGYDLSIGVNKLAFETFFSNLVEYDFTMRFKADNEVKLLGNGTIPWYSLDMNKITRKDVALMEDLPSNDYVNGVHFDENELVVSRTGSLPNIMATMPLATQLTNGAMSSADKAKLDTVEVNAEANPTNAEIVQSIDTELGNTDWKKTIIDPTNTVFVDYRYTGAITDGGYVTPFRDLQEAINATAGTGKDSFFVYSNSDISSISTTREINVFAPASNITGNIVAVGFVNLNVTCYSFFGSTNDSSLVKVIEISKIPTLDAFIQKHFHITTDGHLAIRNDMGNELHHYNRSVFFDLVRIFAPLRLEEILIGNEEVKLHEIIHMYKKEGTNLFFHAPDKNLLYTAWGIADDNTFINSISEWVINGETYTFYDKKIVGNSAYWRWVEYADANNITQWLKDTNTNIPTNTLFKPSLSVANNIFAYGGEFNDINIEDLKTSYDNYVTRIDKEIKFIQMGMHSIQPDEQKEAVEVSFLADRVVPNGVHDVVFDNNLHNFYDNYNFNTGVYTAPYTGSYNFHLKLTSHTVGESGGVKIKVVHADTNQLVNTIEFNGSTVISGVWEDDLWVNQGQALEYTSPKIDVQLGAGDSVKVIVENTLSSDISFIADEAKSFLKIDSKNASNLEIMKLSKRLAFLENHIEIQDTSKKLVLKTTGLESETI